MSLRQRLKDGHDLTGVLLKMPAPGLVELVGHVGFDLVLIDTEHGIADEAQLEHHVRAADSAGVPVVVRVRRCDRATILGVLDAGARGVVVPHVSSSRDAAAAVNFAHYSPLGSRGLALTTRAGLQATRSAGEHRARAVDETFVIVQIEDAEGVRSAASIATTPGVDAVWIGPNDLADSLGHFGEPGHPEVEAAVAEVVAAVATTNTPWCWLSADESELVTRRAAGARVHFVSMHAIVASRSRQLLSSLVRPSARQH